MNKVPNLNNGQQQSIKVEPDDLSYIECPGCGNDNFRTVHKIGKLSKVHPKNTTGETQAIHIPVESCANCGRELTRKDISE